MRICVYCASSATINKKYFEATEALANDFVDNDIEVICGGGEGGLMGQLADTILSRKGKIKGIMPRFMKEVEWAHKGIRDFEVTETRHERKAKLIEDIDGLVTLAGGSGTLEELFETITLKRLGQFTKPIIILNTDGYYDPLKAMLNKTIAENFMHEKHSEMWTFVDLPEQVIPAIKKAAKWDETAIDFATNK